MSDSDPARKPAAGETRKSENPDGASEPRADSRSGDVSAHPISLWPSAAGTDKFREYKHVPLECPNCGFEGKAKITLLDRTFYCKACDQVFHVTVRGTVIGTRPAEEGSVDPGAPIKLEKPNRLELWFGQLSSKARWCLLAVVLVTLGCVALLFVSTQDGPLTRDLQKRAELAGEALAHGDFDTLDRMTMSDGVEALHKWYEAVRPKEFEAVTPESEVSVTVGPLAKLFRRAERVPGKKKKVPVADFSTPLAITVPVSEESQAVAKVDLIWVKEDGEWRIDAAWLAEAQPPIAMGEPQPIPQEVPPEDKSQPIVVPKTARERKQMAEARILEQAEQKQAAEPEEAEPDEAEQEGSEPAAAEPEKAPPLSPAQRRRQREN